jgi:DNA polymerase III alpha subunit
MKIDVYGQHVYNEQDLCNLYLVDPERHLKNVLVEKSIKVNPVLELDTIPTLIQYVESSQTVEEFDSEKMNNWFFPKEYQNFDIAKFVLEQCKNDAELQRAGEELLMYQERDLFMLLRYLKYLVDTMRKHKIVWGVGRGSSVSSFVLYLIGVHRINSLYYDLQISEFLK